MENRIDLNKKEFTQEEIQALKQELEMLRANEVMLKETIIRMTMERMGLIKQGGNMLIKKERRLRIGDIVEVPIKKWINEHAGMNFAVKTSAVVVGVYPHFVNFKIERNDFIHSIQNVDLVRCGIYKKDDAFKNRFGFDGGSRDRYY